ncbi:MAG: polysaccharide export protein [Gammaproteobacteria bacterium]|nr:polysaccharide export protein [Gammaproteobacteria bacterium]MDH5691955.1 polysaccharide export protein [Gammaproteobacteria bacterium]
MNASNAAGSKVGETPLYVIGPGDGLKIFVWRNAELSGSVPVRPDGRISIPLVEDLVAAGKTPSVLAREIEKEMGRFVKDPLVTVIVTGFVGPYDKQVRVIGEAAKPQALPYKANMTVLDVMIAVGGLTEFASGNSAKIVRTNRGIQEEIDVNLEDLIGFGDISQNVGMLPGDILVIPETWF